MKGPYSDPAELSAGGYLARVPGRGVELATALRSPAGLAGVLSGCRGG